MKSEAHGGTVGHWVPCYTAVIQLHACDLLFNPVLHQIVNIVLPDTPLRYCNTLYSGAGFCEEIAPR